MKYVNYDDFEDGFSYTSLGALHFKHHPGTKEKLIFVHGIGFSTLYWKGLMELLPDDLDVFLIDLMGHGESDAPGIDYTIHAQFQAFREFIALQNNGDSYIFGHSYGGWVAAYYATQPCAYKGLILEDAAGLSEFFDDLITGGEADKAKQEMLASTLAEGNKEAVMKDIIYTNFGADALTTKHLSEVSRKCMIIWGSNDNVIPLKYGKMFNDKIKGSKLEIIDGAGHIPHIDHAAKVAALTLDFIGKASTA